MTKTNIKDWLETNYPEEICKKVVEMHIFDKDLEGEVELKREEFPNLERIFYLEDVNLITNWEINLANLLGEKKPKGVKLTVPPQVELLKYFIPDGDIIKDDAAELNLTKKGIRGKLDLRGFTQLEELEIELSSPGNHRHPNSNYITSLDLSQATKLEKITLTNVPVELNLDIFKTLTNLEELNISADNGSGQWVGSLASLKDCPLLKLNIANNPKITDWDNLPITITDLNVKGIPFYHQIKPFAFDVKAWKMVKHSKLVRTDEDELKNELKNKLEHSHQTKVSLNKIGLTDDNLIKQIELLEAKSREFLA